MFPYILFMETWSNDLVILADDEGVEPSSPFEAHGFQDRLTRQLCRIIQLYHRLFRSPRVDCQSVLGRTGWFPTSSDRSVEIPDSD